MTIKEAASPLKMESHSKVANAKTKHTNHAEATTTATNTASTFSTASTLASAINKTPSTFDKENKIEEENTQENVKAAQYKETLQKSNETHTESGSTVESKAQTNAQEEEELIKEEKVLITDLDNKLEYAANTIATTTTSRSKLSTTASLLDPLHVLCIPANMVMIKRFTTLTLTHQSNATALHPHFFLFSNLQVLVLEHNQLTSLLHLLPSSVRHHAPQTTLSSSLSLSESECLSFMQTHATGCVRLKELFLSYNCLTSIWKTDIPRLRNLELLTLAHNQLDSLEETVHCLRKLQQLRYLDLRCNVFNTFSAHNNSSIKHNTKNVKSLEKDEMETKEQTNAIETSAQENTNVLECETISTNNYSGSERYKDNLKETDNAKYNREAHLYRYYVIYHLPQLHVLDRREVTSDERAKASSLFRTSHNLLSKQHTTMNMSANTQHNRQNNFTEIDHTNSICNTVQVETNKGKSTKKLQLSECAKLLHKQYKELMHERKQAEETKQSKCVEEETKLRDKYAAFHLVWTLSQPNMPLCTSDSNTSNTTNTSTSNVSSESKYKRGNSAGSANSNHSGNITHAHASASKRANRSNSKNVNTTLHIVKDGKATIVPNLPTNSAENVLSTDHATRNEKLPSSSSSSASPLSVLTNTSSASSQLKKPASGNKSKKRVLSAESHTSTSLPSSANSNISLNNSNNYNGKTLLPLLSSSSSFGGKGLLNSSLPTIVLPKNKIVEILTMPPLPEQQQQQQQQQQLQVSNESSTNPIDNNDREIDIINIHNETHVPCITRFKEISNVIEPAEELVKSLRCTMVELAHTENDKLNAANHNSITINREKSGKRSATNSVNSKESALGILLIKEQVELLQKIELGKSALIPPPWKELITNSDTSTGMLNSTFSKEYHLENNVKSKTPTNTNNVNKRVKGTNQADRLQVNKRDVVMYTLRAIQLLFTPQELLTLQDTYGDNLLHRALKALNETDTKNNNINKENADDDNKKINSNMACSGENFTGLSFERIFSGKAKEVIPIKSKSDLRKQQQQQQQQQKANARAAALRNRHTQMTSASLRLGEELSEEELELQRVREEEQKHMELFWVALTQPALVSTPNFTNTELPFANYNIAAANKNIIFTSFIATNNNNNNNNNYSHVKRSTNKEVSSYSSHTPMQQKTNKKVEGKNAIHMEDEADKEIDYVSSMNKGTVGSYSLTTLVNFVKNLCFRSHYSELDLTDLLHALMTCHHYTQAIHQNNTITNTEEEMNEMYSCYQNDTSRHQLHRELSTSALNALYNRIKLNDEVHNVSLTHAAKETIGNVDKTKELSVTSKQSKKQEQNKFQENQRQQVRTSTISSGSMTNKDDSQNKNNKSAEQTSISFSSSAANTSEGTHDVNGSADKDRQHKTKEKHHSSQNQVNNNKQISNSNVNKRSVLADKAKGSHGQSEVQNEHTNTKIKQNGKSRDVDHTAMHSSRNKENEYSETKNNSNNDNGIEEVKEEITVSLTINNLLCGLCYYVPFVEQRLRFMREECDKCISALHRTNARDSHKLKDITSNSNKKSKSCTTANSDDESSANCELSNWFARVSFIEEHLQRLRQISHLDTIKLHTTTDKSIKSNNSSKRREQHESVNVYCKQAHSDQSKQNESSIISLDKLLIQPVQSVGSYFVNKIKSNDVK